MSTMTRMQTVSAFFAITLVGCTEALEAPSAPPASQIPGPPWNPTRGAAIHYVYDPVSETCFAYTWTGGNGVPVLSIAAIGRNVWCPVEPRVHFGNHGRPDGGVPGTEKR